MFVFVDEIGTDKRSALRKFGYSFKGQRALSEKLGGSDFQLLQQYA